MGAVSTKTCCASEDDPNDVSGEANTLGLTDEVISKSAEPLTPAEIKLVQSTWATAMTLGAENVGGLLFKKIFEIAPGALELFSFKNEPDIKTWKNKKFLQHGLNVVNAVGAAVDGLNFFSTVLPVLKELAVKHVGYGVQAAHYDVVGKALMQTLRDGLGDSWTKPAQVAWAKVWHAVSTTMIEAQRNASKEFNAQKADFTQPLTEKEIHLVQESWSKVEAGNVDESVGVQLFLNIFKIAPEAVALYPFKADTNLSESPKLRAHGAKVVGTVAVAVKGLNNLPALVPTLQELGTKHTGYMVKQPHYDVVGQALIQTLSETLDKHFTAELKLAWLKVWHIVSTTMMANHYS
mmetsp:Transcript_99253/g.206799  ORF Transcript_99253/g.206799 Transcript_99253/m.206799 type:complete len:350 (+) Transcript_99253:273-1322(+)|eukprot:CAMPEP_0206445712 /NCGR_PEP_ID=MMETSP0324_2-20121206/15678_1 /ASSEMBLY_ACC=CAM_ASM_000836 /TAXON_ID=2866 /ORGANISM="Crypthecodinium cohnii, Strain Seligo" /LENGTH=349 /DNA_ID=CAMNT_0053913993 /DNA_START=183 /DNA_END=1232 /DNA_ORIENTATION=-